MIAYRNDEQIKANAVSRAESHRKQDLLIAGTYRDGHKGCSVGCMYGGNNHADSENFYGIPAGLTHLQDAVFEGLAKIGDGSHRDWHVDFFRSIRAGADLSMAWPRIAVWLLSDPESPVVHNAGGAEPAINGVAELYQEWVSTGEKPEAGRWHYARGRVGAAALKHHDVTHSAAVSARDAADAAHGGRFAGFAVSAACGAADDGGDFWKRFSQVVLRGIAA